MNAQSNVPLCPASVPLQQLTSGSITLTNFNRNQQSYTYNYEKDVQNVDKMVASVSMNSFNAQIDKAISFSIEKNKDSRTGFAFSFRTATNNHWKNMRLGFVISDRTDIELGSATYNSLNSQNSGALTYQLQQKWKHFERLQVATFLTSFQGVSDSGSIGYLITKYHIQNSQLQVFFKEESQTRIEQISLDLVIFDPFNPNLRFQHRQLTDTFISSTQMGYLPPALTHEKRM